MIDYASKHLDPALTPQILLKSANLIKEIVWVSKRGKNLKKTTKKNSFLVIYGVALWVNAGYILHSFQDKDIHLGNIFGLGSKITTLHHTVRLVPGRLSPQSRSKILTEIWGDSLTTLMTCCSCSLVLLHLINFNHFAQRPRSTP